MIKTSADAMKLLIRCDSEGFQFTEIDGLGKWKTTTIRKIDGELQMYTVAEGSRDVAPTAISYETAVRHIMENLESVNEHLRYSGLD